MSAYLKALLDQLKNLRKSGSFAQNIGIVFSGNAVNFFIQMLLTPVVSRIYGPEAYGEYAYFNLIISNIVFIGGLSFPTVYVIPKRQYDFLALGKYVILSVMGVSVFTIAVYFLLKEYITILEYNGFIIPLFTIIIVFNAINNVFTNWNIRKKDFKRNSYVSIGGNLSSKSAAISVGYFIFSGGVGLLIGDLVRSIFLFFFQISKIARNRFFRFLFRRNGKYIKWIFKKNIDVVKYIYPSQILNKFTYDIPLLIIGGIFSTEYLGLYTFAIGILNIPRNLISRAVHPVFFQKANELFQRDPKLLGPFLSKIFLSALIFTFIPLTFISLWAEEVFTVVFGEEWKVSGKIATLITFQFILTTIAESFGGIRRILGLQKKILVLTTLSTGLRMLPFLTILYEIDFFNLIFLYSFAQALFVIISFSDLFLTVTSRSEAVRIIIITMIIFSVGIIVSYFGAI